MRCAERPVLYRRLTELDAVLEKRYSQSKRKAEIGTVLGGIRKKISIAALRVRLHAVTRELSLEMRKDNGRRRDNRSCLTPSKDSGGVYNDIRSKVLKTLHEEEVGYHGFAVTPSEWAAPSSEEAIADVGNRSFVVPQTGPNLDPVRLLDPFLEEVVSPETQSMEENVPPFPEEEGHFLEGLENGHVGGNPPGEDDGEMTAATFSEIDRVAPLNLRYTFEQVTERLVPIDKVSCVDLIDTLAHLRRGALEEFFACDQALRSLLATGATSGGWQKLYAAADYVYLEGGLSARAPGHNTPWNQYHT